MRCLGAAGKDALILAVLVLGTVLFFAFDLDTEESEAVVYGGTGR